MRVGITTFGGDGGTSGISRYIIKVIERLALLPDRPELEVLVYDDERSIFIPSQGNVECLAFPGTYRNPVANLVWHQVALPRVCKDRGYDVLFLPAGNRRLPYWAPCPTVGTVHDLSSIHVPGKYDRARMFYVKKALPILIRKLDVVLTVSESSKKDIARFCRVPSERIFVTPNGVDHDSYFPKDKDEARRSVQGKYNIRPPYILYVSRLEHPGKNHRSLIKAFEILKSTGDSPHQLVLAGSDWLRADEVHKMADASPYSKDILFTGFFAGGDLPDLYSGADLFVFPSLYEGFGIPILEAMACGTAVACSNISSMPEVAGDAALLFDPHSPVQIAQSMRRLLEDESLRSECVRKGLERSGGYTWANTAAMTMDAFKLALEARS